MSFLHDLCTVWKSLMVIMTPLMALPILFIDGSKEMACLYGIVITVVYWITEALPIPITSLCPFVLFPALGVLPVDEVAASYVKDTMLFGLSCLSFALCVERWNLHRRIALNCLLLFGSSPKWLMLGFMVPCWLLSMFISNTSTTAMMIPVATAVLTNLREINVAVNNDPSSQYTQTSKSSESAVKPSLNTTDAENEMTKCTMDHHPNMTKVKQYDKFCKVLNLCICYSATIGGIGSLTGTGPNLIMQGQADETFGLYGLDSGLNFLSWMMCCLPISALCLALAWMWMVVYFLGFRGLLKCSKDNEQEKQLVREVIQSFIKELGPISFAEKAVICLFVMLLSLWLTSKLPGGYGWSRLFKSGFATNSTAGIPFLALLMIFPSDWRRRRSKPTLLDWSTVHNKYPWSFFLLMGGGFCIATTCQKSGLSLWIASRLLSLAQIQPWLCAFVLSLLISFLTEMTSNSATMSVLCPILVEMAIAANANPLLFLFPGCLASSLAFMFPVATPPNALVFASGYVTILDMVKAGFVLNVLCVGVVNLGMNLWGDAIFGLGTLPEEMRTGLSGNTTVDIFLNTSQTN